jgi:multiple sugar transport system ATP-binding protein
VDRVEYLSGDRHVYGTVTGLGEETRVIARLPAMMVGEVTEGSHEFAVAADRVRFFDAQSERRTDPVRLGTTSG